MSHIYIDLFNSKFTFFSFSYKEQWTLKTKKMVYYLNFFIFFYFLLLMEHTTDSYSCYHSRVAKTGHVIAQCPSCCPICLQLYISLLWSYVTFSHFYFLKYIYLLMWSPEEGIGSLVTGSIHDNEPPSRCWDSSSGPLEEPSKVSTTNLPPHLEIVICSQFYNRFM